MSYYSIMYIRNSRARALFCLCHIELCYCLAPGLVIVGIDAALLLMVATTPHGGQMTHEIWSEIWS